MSEAPSGEPSKIRVELDAEQKAAVSAPNSPLRINAGAGSGKTTVISERIAALIAAGAEASSVLCLTFSNKAAENLRRKVVETAGSGLEVTVATYHGFGASIVVANSLLLGFERRPRLIDRAEAFQVLYGSLDEVILERRKVGRLASLVAAALRLSSQCSDQLVEVDTLIADCDTIIGDKTIMESARLTATSRRDLARMVAVYEREKRSRNLIDFGDQISLAFKAASTIGEAAVSVRGKYQFLLLDEYQDTNFAQRCLLQAVFPQNGAITAVGDDLQSIYAFRGAHVENLIHFDRHFGMTQAVNLTTNYRSGEKIVALANRVAGRVSNSLPKQLVAARESARDSVFVVAGKDDFDEAELIADWISNRGPDWNETVVLARKRKVFAAVAEALRRRSIPTDVVGSGGLLDRPEIVDVVAWLELLTLPQPNVALLRLARSPLRNIGLADLAHLGRHAQRLARDRSGEAHPSSSLVEALHDLDGIVELSQAAWQRLKTLQSQLTSLVSLAPVSSLPVLIDRMAAIEGLHERVGIHGYQNLLAFRRIVAGFEANNASTVYQSTRERIDSLRNYLSLIVDSEDEPPASHDVSGAAVRLMTIHQAKGLEFDHVVVAGLSGSGSSRLFPDQRGAENSVTVADMVPWWLRQDNHGFNGPPRTKNAVSAIAEAAKVARSDEELRLLYVAITRARRALLCTGSQWFPGATRPQGLSEFFELISSQTDIVEQLRPIPAPAETNPQHASRQRLALKLKEANGVANHSSDSRTTGQVPNSSSKSNRSRRVDQVGLLMTPEPNTGQVAQAYRPWPRAITASAACSALRCPAQYRWTYLDPKPYLPHENRSGIAFHTKIGRLLLDPSADLIDADAFGTTRHLEDAEIAPQMAVFKASRWLKIPFAVEKRFKFSIDLPAVASAVILPADLGAARQSISISGRIDAVFIDSNLSTQGIVIADWKYSAATQQLFRKTLRIEDHLDQMLLYAEAARTQWGIDLANLQLFVVTIGTDGLLEEKYTFCDQDLGELKARLASSLSAASAKRVVTRPGSWCGSCNFANTCPDAYSTNHSGASAMNAEQASNTQVRLF